MTLTVLVTGGSRGIGYATAELFAARGWNVVLCSRNKKQAEDAAYSITKVTKNANVLGVEADIGNGTSVDSLFKAADARFPTLDAIINNAAILNQGSIFELKDAAFEEMMRINVTGMVQCCRHAFERMKTRGGSIVNISSLAGILHVEKIPGFWGYSASKAAVIGLTEALAVEGAPYRIRVNCIAPGATDTEMLHKAAPGLKPNAVPADIAKIAYYLCDKDQSGIVSGSIIPVFSNS